MTGPSVGPGMLLTVLMRWPALIAVLAVCGGALYGYKEYGLPDSVELALLQFQGKPVIKKQTINDSDTTKVVDHLMEATKPKAEVVAVPASASKLSQPLVKNESKAEVVLAEKYRVVEGDSLSKIAAQRSSNVMIQRELINNIFSANQHAFKDSDPNHLIANVEIIIPLK